MQSYKSNQYRRPIRRSRLLIAFLRIVLFFVHSFSNISSFFKKLFSKKSPNLQSDQSIINYQKPSENNDGNDEKFISDRTNKKNHKAKKPITPINTTHRGLDKETGGLEVDYKKVHEAIEKNVDVWDNRVEQISQMGDEAQEDNADILKSFIHKVKTGKYRKKSMGQVELGSENANDISHAEKVEMKRQNENSRGDKSR